MAQNAKPSSTMLKNPTATIVQQGKLLDFIDQTTQRNESLEEYVRQEIAKSLVREYGYPRGDIGVEYRMKVGSGRPRADLVIFEPDAMHTQENAYIIIECKNEKIKASARKDGVGQLHSYMSACPNAHYGMWTNSIDRFCYRSVVENGRRSFVEISDIPDFGETEEDRERPTFSQLKPASSDALLFAFRRCHNYVSGNQGLQKPEAFWELLKLIFCKIHDERHSTEVQFYAPAGGGTGMASQLGVKKRIDSLFSEVKNNYPQIFKLGEEVELNKAVLTYIVGQLQSYTLLDSDIDVKGKAYEEIVGSNLRGDRGEFFTPRNMCRMAVAMLSPTENDRLLDPACGTGGFLITAMNHVVRSIRESEIKKWGDAARAEAAIRARSTRFTQHGIIGLDLNPNLVKAAKMNMVMNDDGAVGLHQANSLGSPSTWSEDVRALQLLGSVDVLVTNPPFGSKIPVDEPSILEQYDLGHIWSYDAEADQWVKTDGIQRSQPPEILFIERCVQFLKPGKGRAAIVVPDGILGSPGLGYVRQWLLTHTTILASIDMHPDAFQPKNSVQTSVLVFRRKTDDVIAVETAQGRINDYPIFMALASHIGHNKRGVITYKRDSEGNELVEEVEEEVKEYENGRPVVRLQTSHRKIVDDTTADIAQIFRQWLVEAEA